MSKNIFSRMSDERVNYDLSFEHGLRKTFGLLFLLLILVQSAMLNGTVRSFLTSATEFDGRPLAVNEMLFNEGRLRLQLLALIPDPNIRVTVNGDEVAYFQTNIVEVKVKDGDVLGINCTGSNQKGEIEIVSKTANIQNKCVGSRFKTDGNPKGTLRLKVNNSEK